MSDNFYLRQSPEGINYLDYSDHMGVPCGIIIKNEGVRQKELENFIVSSIGASLGATGKKQKTKFKLIRLLQKHTNIVAFSTDYGGKPADAAYTDNKNHVLIVKTADCFPIFLSDGKTVGLIHAGWRGVLSGIIGNFFDHAKTFEAGNCRVAIGPGIDKCCFEVSPEVALLFDKEYRLKLVGKYYVDIKRLILDELKDHGIKYSLVDDVCTSCNVDKFYSYRREGIKVRQMLSYIYPGG